MKEGDSILGMGHHMTICKDSETPECGVFGELLVIYCAAWEFGLYFVGN